MLDDAFIINDFVEVQRVHPFRVESGKHLVHDNEQIELLTAVRCYTTVRILCDSRDEMSFFIARPMVG